MLLTVLQLAMLLQPAIAWLCGPKLVCDCVDDYWIMCDGIDTTPNFKMNVRRRHGILISINNDADFELDSLRLTHGFHTTVVRAIAMPSDYCDVITTGYPWITCQTLTASATPPEKTEASVTPPEKTEPSVTEGKTDDLTTKGKTTSDETTVSSTEFVSVSFEASVSFELKNSITTNDPENVNTGKALMDLIKKSPALFWTCIVLGVILLTIITVMSILFVLKRTGDPDASLAAKCCACLCKLCLCPCKCLDKIRARERPYYRDHALPLHRMVNDDSSEVEVFTQ